MFYVITKSDWKAIPAEAKMNANDNKYNVKIVKDEYFLNPEVTTDSKKECLETRDFVIVPDKAKLREYKIWRDHVNIGTLKLSSDAKQKINNSGVSTFYVGDAVR